VEGLLRTRHDVFDAGLRRLSGRQELGVKAYADPRGLVPSEDASQAAGHKSGTAYLLRRRWELEAREEAYRCAAEEAMRIHDTLMRCAVDGIRKPAVDKSLSGTSSPVVLNGTYLVEDGMVELFREAVETLNRTTARITLEITGPWPPYSFAGNLEAS
jgi:hypothetical protein